MDQKFKDASIAILYEIFPNPEIQRAEYIEIYNPGSTSISLSKYQICMYNTDSSQSSCRQLTNNYTLQSKESYVFCRDQNFVEDNNMLPSNKMCHQDGNNNFRLRNRNQQVVLTQNNIEVDEVSINNANKRKGQAYVRKNGCNAKNSDNCWVWSSEVAMATTTTVWDNNDDEILAESQVEIGIQSLPPSDIDGNVADVYGDEWWQ